MFGFPKSLHLLKSAEFDRVFAARASQSDGRMIVYVAANDLGHPRLGLVVSRKVGNSVTRNRWKRCLREAFRLSQGELPAGHDLVVLPKAQATPQTAELRESLQRLAHAAAGKLAAKAKPESPQS